MIETYHTIMATKFMPHYKGMLYTLGKLLEEIGKNLREYYATVK